MKMKICNKAQAMMGGMLATRHAHELLKITGAIADSIEFTGEPHWYGISMDTGGGKSTVITATALVTHDEGIEYPMLVAVPNLQSMAEMYERLIANGYPVQLIGKVFSAGAGGTEERKVLGEVTQVYQLSQKKILLICHQRMGSRDWAKYKQSRWGTRSCFWDEAIQYGESFSFPKEGTVRRLQLGAAFESGSTVCKDWFTESLGLVSGCKVGDLISLPPEVPESIGYFIKQAAENAKRRGLGDDWGDIEKLAETAGVDIRMAEADVLTFTYKFPDDLQNLFVFDAGHKHSELAMLDERIEVLESEPWKEHKNVTIYQGRGGTSMDYIEKNKDGDEIKGQIRKYLEMIGGEPFIVLTKKDYVKWLKPDYEFTDDQIVTYGKEQGINKFGDVKHILVVGLNRVQVQAMEAKWLLYSRDINADYSKARGYVETAAMLQWYQGVSRTHLRFAQRDRSNPCVAQAGEANIYMVGRFKKDIESYVRTTLMPGCRIVDLDKGFDLIQKMDEVIKKESGGKISKIKLWRGVGLKLNQREKDAGITQWLDQNPGWSMDVRTLRQAA